MGHKCYISFKAEDEDYKKHIQENLNIDMIDKSLDEPIESQDEDYIMQKIRDDYLSDSTVTIHLIGLYGAESRGWWEQRFIKRELQASLYDGKNNSRSGILGVVLPEMKDVIFKGSIQCVTCSNSHNLVIVNNSTVIREFSYNYFIPHSKCSWSEEDRYCVLVDWDDFCKNPEQYIDQAYNKRGEPIAKKVKVRPDL
ncbi:MAG: TIR domain-containing protein [Ignavibacterium sp.]|jgi:hypothetical protein|nr:TIR domain-containing protein [Ignavibacterium sp.]